MAENPPLNRFYVLGYSANDKDFPIISANFDPRVAGYKVPEDLSTCPDKRYPNHVFTGAQPLSGDERVRHVWEILPSPWIPFTRYDDDLGPIQGRRRSVANTGQEASLDRDKKVSYEAREGSAIVSTELEETWDAGPTDPDEPSPFPIRDRDFYDPSRGAVQERRQLVSTTGNEVATLENNNGVITQTSYEAYNEYLSFKIVQTYSVDGPQLVGTATNNEGQVVTITTQRKASDNYVPPQPTATKTVEASREDAESLIERVTETPSVFTGEVRSVEKSDNIPTKFQAAIPVSTTEISTAGTIEAPSLTGSEIAKSEQQVTEFVKRTRTTTRPSTSKTLFGKVFTTELGGGMANVIETYPSGSSPDTIAYGTVSDETENLGDGKSVRRVVSLTATSQSIEDFDESGSPIGTPSAVVLPILRGQDYDQELDIVIPYSRVFAKPNDTNLVQGQDGSPLPRRRIDPRDPAHSLVVKYDVEDVQDSLDEYYWEVPDMISVTLPDKLISASLRSDGSFAQSESTATGDTYSLSESQRSSVGGTLSYNIERGFNGWVPTRRAIFFLPKGSASPQSVLARVNQESGGGIQFWPNARPQGHQVVIIEISNYTEKSNSVSFDSSALSTSNGATVSTKIAEIPPTIHGAITFGSGNFGGAGSVTVEPSSLPATTPFAQFPVGTFLYQINATPYRFSYVRIDALLVQITNEYR